MAKYNEMKSMNPNLTQKRAKKIRIFRFNYKTVEKNMDNPCNRISNQKKILRTPKDLVWLRLLSKRLLII